MSEEERAKTLAQVRARIDGFDDGDDYLTRHEARLLLAELDRVTAERDGAGKANDAHAKLAQNWMKWCGEMKDQRDAALADVARLRGLVRGDGCACCVEHDCDCMAGVTWGVEPTDPAGRKTWPDPKEPGCCDGNGKGGHASDCHGRVST